MLVDIRDPAAPRQLQSIPLPEGGLAVGMRLEQPIVDGGLPRPRVDRLSLDEPDLVLDLPPREAGGEGHRLLEVDAHVVRIEEELGRALRRGRVGTARDHQHHRQQRERQHGAVAPDEREAHLVPLGPG